MSGTSHDGIDSATARIAGAGPSAKVKLLHWAHYPYPKGVRERIASAFDGRTEDICRLNFELAGAFAGAALSSIRQSGIRPDAIASHGQTIYHIPPAGKKQGSTLQIGAPSVIAQKTGVPVVADFRPADMAAGGQGAPLVPYADYILFRGRQVKAVQNIGGIANVTVVTPKIDDVIAFDTGPGNALMDEAMKLLLKRPFDRGGRAAMKGSPDEKLLTELMSHPYLKLKPPKSTGRELFGKPSAEAVIRRHRQKNPFDIIATLTRFTALSIRGAYERFVLPRHDLKEIILCGGGTKNGYLVGLLREMFAGVKVSLIEEYGIPSEAKEALSFAVLANETLSGRPSNVPGATGAKRRVVLGGIFLP